MGKSQLFGRSGWRRPGLGFVQGSRPLASAVALSPVSWASKDVSR
jgi:hypothetical protein